MTKSCVECGNKIPLSSIVDGKRRNLQNRTKCLNCLPFGSSQYATPAKSSKCKQLDYVKKFKDLHGIDPIGLRRISRRYYFTSLLVDGCQICGYNKTSKNLVFHHTNNKEARLSSREFQFSWERTKLELQKCCVVCHNCHGEIHSNLVDSVDVDNLFASYQLKLQDLLEHKTWDEFLDNTKCVEIFHSNFKKLLIC